MPGIGTTMGLDVTSQFRATCSRLFSIRLTDFPQPLDERPNSPEILGVEDKLAGSYIREPGQVFRGMFSG